MAPPPSYRHADRILNSPTLDLTNESQVQKARAWLGNWFRRQSQDPPDSPDRSSKLLQELGRATLAAVQASQDKPEFTKRTSRSFQDGWSEPMMIHHARLTALLSILRGLRGRTQRKVGRWLTFEDYQLAIKQIVLNWTDTVVALSPSPEAAWTTLNGLEHGPDFWLSLNELPAVDTVLANIREVRRELQGRKRLQVRAERGKKEYQHKRGYACGRTAKYNRKYNSRRAESEVQNGILAAG